jgi:hypothetical protein
MREAAGQGAGGRVSDISSSHWLESAEVITAALSVYAYAPELHSGIAAAWYLVHCVAYQQGEGGGGGAVVGCRLSGHRPAVRGVGGCAANRQPCLSLGPNKAFALR